MDHDGDSVTDDDIKIAQSRLNDLTWKLQDIEGEIADFGIRNDPPSGRYLLDDAVAISMLNDLEKHTVGRDFCLSSSMIMKILDQKISNTTSGRRSSGVYEIPHIFQVKPELIAEHLEKPWYFFVCPGGRSYSEEQFPNDFIPPGTWKLDKTVRRVFSHLREIGKLRLYHWNNYILNVYRKHSNTDTRNSSSQGDEDEGMVEDDVIAEEGNDLEVMTDPEDESMHLGTERRRRRLREGHGRQTSEGTSNMVGEDIGSGTSARSAS